MAKRIAIILLAALFVVSGLLALWAGHQTYARVMHDYDELGRQNAMLGAHTTEYVIEKAIANGILEMRTLFDDDYRLIAGTDPPRYHSSYNLYLERNLGVIQDSFLDAEPIYYAYCISNNGYVPVHTNPAMLGRRLDPIHRHTSDGAGAGEARNTVEWDGYTYYEYSYWNDSYN